MLDVASSGGRVMRLTQPRECTVRAKERHLVLVRLELDYAHVLDTALGRVGRATVISKETADKIMDLLDQDTAAKR